MPTSPCRIDAPAHTACVYRKFGKQIQKRQLEVPEYAASFVNYKALKKVRHHRSQAIVCTMCLPIGTRADDSYVADKKALRDAYSHCPK